MKKLFLIVSLFTAMLLLQSVAIAQEALTPAQAAGVGEPVKEVAKEVKLPSKNYVRKIGEQRKFVPNKKSDAIAASAKALAPGQVKKTVGAKSARGFVRNPVAVSAKKKEMFQSIAMKQKPQKPVKGQKTTFRGTPYKPTKI